MNTLLLMLVVIFSPFLGSPLFQVCRNGSIPQHHHGHIGKRDCARSFPNACNDPSFSHDCSIMKSCLPNGALSAPSVLDADSDTEVEVFKPTAAHKHLFPDEELPNVRTELMPTYSEVEASTWKRIGVGKVLL